MQDVPFEHYLEAKRLIDDRSLNKRVWETFATTLGAGRRSVLEIGAGTGTMLERLAYWGLPGPLDYTGIEPDPGLASMAGRRSYPPEWEARFENLTLETVSGAYDAVLANAVLDILPAFESLGRIHRLLRPEGLFYATITFDGLTVFQSLDDVEKDNEVLKAYHLAMDSRKITGEGHGGANAGRMILTMLQEAGFCLLAAGSSDWIIAPGKDGYLPEEHILVTWLLGTIRRAVGEVLSDSRLEGERSRRGIDLSSPELDRWIAARYRQLEEGRLVVIAHQIDFCSQKLS